MSPSPEYAFTGPTVRITVDGCLFDMDGTIIDSTDAVVKYWKSVSDEIGVPHEQIMQTAHGRRSIDTLAVLAPEKATWEYVREMEGSMPRLYGRDVVEIPGARALLAALDAGHAPWAIVTSGSQPLVTGWLGVLGLPRPAHLISAEAVAVGKPHPACYELGLAALGRMWRGSQPAEAETPGTQPGADEATDVRSSDSVPSVQPLPSSVVVLEDSPAGIEAGRAAGCRVLAVVTSHSAAQVAAARPDWAVRDLQSVRVVGVAPVAGGGPGAVRATLELRDTMEEVRKP